MELPHYVPSSSTPEKTVTQQPIINTLTNDNTSLSSNPPQSQSLQLNINAKAFVPSSRQQPVINTLTNDNTSSSSNPLSPQSSKLKSNVKTVKPDEKYKTIYNYLQSKSYIQINSANKTYKIINSTLTHDDYLHLITLLSNIDDKLSITRKHLFLSNFGFTKYTNKSGRLIPFWV